MTVAKVRKAAGVRVQVLAEIFRRLGNKSPPDVSHFGLAVREVIRMRMWRAMTGELSASEARRMVTEKQLAAVQAHLAYTKSILTGEAGLALGAYFDVYRHAVESNRRRLRSRRRRWRWFR